LQRIDGVAARTELLRPAGHKGRRADDESAEGGILHQTDGLKGLSETHVVTENTTATNGGILGFALQHPPDAGNLVGQILNALTGRQEDRNRSHFQRRRKCLKMNLSVKNTHAITVTFNTHAQRVRCLIAAGSDDSPTE
jgi:hypothetical protein